MEGESACENLYSKIDNNNIRKQDIKSPCIYTWLYFVFEHTAGTLLNDHRQYWHDRTLKLTILPRLDMEINNIDITGHGN